MIMGCKTRSPKFCRMGCKTYDVTAYSSECDLHHDIWHDAFESFDPWMDTEEAASLAMRIANAAGETWREYHN